MHVREVGSVIQEMPLVLPARTQLVDARRQMVEQRCDALVVVDELADTTRYGIITARDVLRAVAERRLGASVGDLATFPLLTVSRSSSLFNARKLFHNHHIRHLGVSNDDGTVIGLLSFSDIMGSVEEGYIRELRAELRQQTEQLRISEAQVKRQSSITEAVLDALPISVMVKDSEGKILLANKMVGDDLGLPRDLIVGKPAQDFLQPDCILRHAEDDARARASGQTLVREIQRPNGQTLIEHKRAVNLGENSLLINASIDVSDWKRADALMVSSHHVLELIVGGAELPVVLNAICQRMEVHLPESMCSILLLEEDRLRNGASPSLPQGYVRGIDGVAIGPAVGSCGTAAFRGEQVIVEDIATSPLWKGYAGHPLKYGLRTCWSTPFFSSNRKVLGTFAIYFAESRAPQAADLEVIAHATHLASVAVERWQQIADLRRLATTDLLTNLHNRAAFFDRVQDELRQARRFEHDSVMLMIDLDRFKRINDEFGHGTGDEALRTFARVLRAQMREVDILGRVGGEEFAAMLPETDLAGGLEAAERLRLAVEAAEVPVLGGGVLSFTASIGVAAPRPGEALDRMVARADAALYTAKNNGRNRVESAEGDLPESA